MDRPYMDSIPTACVFIAIFIILPHTPKTINAIIICKGVFTIASSTNVSGLSIDAASKSDLEPNLDDNHADKGKLISCPAGKANSTSPRPASLNCMLFFMSGIRLAQEEKINPETKKNALTAILKILGCIVNVVFIGTCVGYYTLVYCVKFTH